MVGKTPTVTEPRKRRLAPSTSSRILTARSRNDSPCGVSLASRLVRSNRRSPSSSSSFLICWLKEGWETWHCSAAREKLRVRATATTYRSWCISIGASYGNQRKQVFQQWNRGCSNERDKR